MTIKRFASSEQHHYYSIQEMQTMAITVFRVSKMSNGGSAMARIFLSFVLLMLCSCGADLTEDEARKLLEIELGLPKLIEREYKIDEKSYYPENPPYRRGGKLVLRNSKAFEGLQQLVSEGYFRRNPKPGGFALFATEKGKANLGNVDIITSSGRLDVSSPSYRFKVCRFKASIYKQVFGRIEEILMDPHTQKKATVTFTTKWDPIEPFFSLICQEGCELRISWRESYYGTQTIDGLLNIVEFLDQVTPYAATFTKYDKGWRVDRCFEMSQEDWEKKKRLLQTSKH
ncbi:hypothetical protein MJD09_18805 [bacterium]|nr:hypothetical protein [bacterium]